MVLTSLRSSVSVIHVNESEAKEEAADYQTALSATGFGLYNIFLVLILIPAAWASNIDISTGTFLLASAECDFQMTLVKKGLLVGVPYIGMMLSSFFWDFIKDRIQRRRLILLALLIDALCNTVGSLVESYYVYILLKFITGTIVGGPLSMLLPYLNEFQPEKYRSRVSTWAGFIFSLGFVIPPIVAFNTLPESWSFIIFDRVYPSWRIYLLICSIPSVLGFFAIIFLPESPKRLMEDGHITKANELLKHIYLINTRKSMNTYSIKHLKSPMKRVETEPREANVQLSYRKWNDIKLLFGKGYSNIFLVLIFLQFIIMVGCNTMRLWAPHLFIIINNFDYNVMWGSNRDTLGLCDSIKPGFITSGLANETHYANQTCVQWIVRRHIYINSTIIALSGIFFSFFFGLFYTTAMRKRLSVVFVYVFTMVCTFGDTWGSTLPLLMLAASMVVSGRITSNIIITTNANVIPHPLRATAITILTHIGNSASLIGNFIFPFILQFHCYGTFMAICGYLIVCLLITLWVLRSKFQTVQPSVS